MPRSCSRPLFQRRQYQFIADALRDARARVDRRVDPAGDHRLCELARLFADRLEHTNMHFNRARFLSACEVED